MKNIRSILFLACTAFLFSGCNSLNKYFYSYQRIRPDYEEKTIGTENVFKPAGNPVPSFKFIENNGLLGIDLSYSQVMEEYEISTVQVYKFYHEGQDMKTGRWENIRESEREKEGEPKKLERRTGNKKTEMLLPPDGTELIVTIGKTGIPSLSGEGGALLFTEELQAKVLMTASSKEDFSNCIVEIPSLALRSRADLSKTKFVEKAHSDLIAVLPQSAINSPSTYETFAKAVVALKPKMQYPFQEQILLDILKDKARTLTEQLKEEKAPIADAFPEFFIQGEITDTSENNTAISYYIWGSALPIPMNRTTAQSDGYRNVKSNIGVVLRKNIKTETIMRNGTIIIIQGGFYYVGHEYGTNTNGQRVPVFLYCNDISQVLSAGDRGVKLNSLNTQIASVEEIYSRYIEQLK